MYFIAVLFTAFLAFQVSKADFDLYESRYIPGVTTQAPGVTTQAPGVTTQAPGVTTPAPVTPGVVVPQDIPTVTLNLHNMFRSFHGANPLTYDTALQAQAQVCADGYATAKYDPDVTKSKLCKPAGGDVVMKVPATNTGSSPSVLAAAALYTTYDAEKLLVDTKPTWAALAPEPTVRNFFQIVWKATKKVGCVLSRPISKTRYLVCVYSAGGNSVDPAQYEKNVAQEAYLF